MWLPGYKKGKKEMKQGWGEGGGQEFDKGVGEVTSQHFPLLGSHLPRCSLLISFPPTHSGLGNTGHPSSPPPSLSKPMAFICFFS